MSFPAGHVLIKGQATENDFLFLIDPAGDVRLTAADVAAVCDRHAGIGADGLIRVVRTQALSGTEELVRLAPQAEWFMDYYNADGTVAEMCGNAARVFGLVLAHEGLAQIPDGASITIGTRGGARTLTRCGELWTVDMGPARLIRPAGATGEVDGEGWDTEVEVLGVEGVRAGLSIAMPNPHTVVALATEDELEAATLGGLTGSDTVVMRPAPPEGTNLELVVWLGELDADADMGGGIEDDAGAALRSAHVGRARLRILERGVGETRSCGTGCCAAAVALHEWLETSERPAPQDYLLDVPGGQIGVHVGDDPWAPDATVLLTGPAALVARLNLAPWPSVVEPRD